ncbi:tail fiber assembly protein [Pectobacterium versatile]|uniref:tail fiber assembly protein n=1 Tax=Pectobacterium versatile TaxID=2488639 RepID=UPI0030181857
MKYFKDSNNNVYAYDDDVLAIKDGLISLTEKEALLIVTPIQSKESHVNQARAERDALIDKATISISILSDAQTLDMATKNETALLTKWQAYRVLLNRIDINTAPDITWPEAPQ